MSQDDTLGGHTQKDYALTIVLVAIAFVFIVVGIGVALAIANPNTDLAFSGSFNLDEYQAAILLLVGAGITMVTQQLTSRNTMSTMKATDDAWIESEK